MSSICSFSMEKTHTNVEFGVLQKTSKQSLISIFFQIGRGTPPSHTHPPLGTSSLDQGLRPCLHQLDPPPTHNFLDPPLPFAAYVLTVGWPLTDVRPHGNMPVWVHDFSGHPSQNVGCERCLLYQHNGTYWNILSPRTEIQTSCFLSLILK